MLGFLHGYLLEGSGSCLWTRAIIRSMCEKGHNIHLICQENHPDKYDFIESAINYDKQLKGEETFSKESPYSGKCMLHKPYIGNTLPVYVPDKYEEFEHVIPMTEADDKTIKKYIHRNFRAVRKIVKENRISQLIANHTVLMPTIAKKIKEDQGIPYAIVIHGSAIEFTVKKDERFHAYAQEAIQEADTIFYYNHEIKTRLKGLFPKISDFDSKLQYINLGVDTSLFQLVENSRKSENINSLKASLENEDRGRKAENSDFFEKELTGDTDKKNFLVLIKEADNYYNKLPDEDVSAKLDRIRWGKDPVVIFLGRMMLFKGLHYLLAAFPQVLKKHPDTKLVCVGHGPLREFMEAWLVAIRNKWEGLIKKIPQWAASYEGVGPENIKAIDHFFDRLEKEKKFDSYVNNASEMLKKDPVIFTGYLTHQELRYLYPCCDVAVFPSIVKEAGPLVLFEAMASGVFPVGTYFGGMAVSIDIAGKGLPEEHKKCMKTDPRPEKIIESLSENITCALSLKGKYNEKLSRTAKDNFDWESIAEQIYKLSNEMKPVRTRKKTPFFGRK